MSSSICDPKSYPPGGGTGKGDNPCDDKPEVSPTKVTGCSCPPKKSAYGWRKAALILNVLPIFGQVINSALGKPNDCAQAFANSSAQYASAQTQFMTAAQKDTDAYASTVGIMRNIFNDTGSGPATGILPTAISVAMEPAVATIFYLRIIGIAVFLILLGVIFTL